MLIVTVTYAVGLVGAGRILASRWVGGAMTVADDSPDTSPQVQLPTVSLEGERARPNRDRLEAAAWFAEPAQRDLPVVYYADSWVLDKFLGPPKVVYPSDDYMMADEVGEAIGEYLRATPEALVVVSGVGYAFLFDGVDPTPDSNFYWPFRSELLGGFLTRFSSTHYGPSVTAEVLRKHQRWERTVGAYLREAYRVERSFGTIHVLTRSAVSTSDGGP